MKEISHRITCSIVLIVLLFGIVASCSASPSGKLVLSTPLESSWVLADFDGDQNPDYANIVRTARQGAGYRSRLDVVLGLKDRRSLSIVQDDDVLGLEVAAIDVDGDNDLDIVISHKFLGSRVGIWINDGHGSFAETSPVRFPQLAGVRNFKAATLDTTGQDFDIRPIRYSLEDTTFFELPLPTKLTSEVSGGEFIEYPNLKGSGPHPLRAPPSSLTF